MLQAATIGFLKEIAVNNNKPWFDAHKETYEAAKKDFEQLVTSLLEALVPMEPALANQKAKDCIFRIYRDVRFAKDKTPYKENFSAYFSKGGKKFPGAGFYLHLQPGGKSMAGGGLWNPEAPLLKALRQEIDYNFEEFQQIINQKDFKKTFGPLKGDQLKSAPQGYEADNPAIEYLKMKSFVVMHPIDDKDWTGKNFAAKCAGTFNTMKPLIDFLNKSLD
jgi:uncharacterized protein (TIGR02453 family)